MSDYHSGAKLTPCFVLQPHHLTQSRSQLLQTIPHRTHPQAAPLQLPGTGMLKGSVPVLPRSAAPAGGRDPLRTGWSGTASGMSTLASPGDARRLYR